MEGQDKIYRINVHSTHSGKGLYKVDDIFYIGDDLEYRIDTVVLISAPMLLLGMAIAISTKIIMALSCIVILY